MRDSLRAQRRETQQRPLRCWIADAPSPAGNGGYRWRGQGARGLRAPQFKSQRGSLPSSPPASETNCGYTRQGPSTPFLDLGLCYGPNAKWPPPAAYARGGLSFVLKLCFSSVKGAAALWFSETSLTNPCRALPACSGGAAGVICICSSWAGGGLGGEAYTTAVDSRSLEAGSPGSRSRESVSSEARLLGSASSLRLTRPPLHVPAARGLCVSRFPLLMRVPLGLAQGSHQPLILTSSPP